MIDKFKKIKVGDKFLCIKDLCKGGNRLRNKKGEIYEVILTPDENSFPDYFLLTYEGGNSYQGTAFSMENLYNSNYVYLLFDYFIDIKTVRKQKLLKIKGGLDEDRLSLNTILP